MGKGQSKNADEWADAMEMATCATTSAVGGTHPTIWRFRNMVQSTMVVLPSGGVLIDAGFLPMKCSPDVDYIRFSEMPLFPEDINIGTEFGAFIVPKRIISSQIVAYVEDKGQYVATKTGLMRSKGHPGSVEFHYPNGIICLSGSILSRTIKARC